MNPRVCRAGAVALSGLEGTRVLVEAGASQQLPGIAIIGLPDTALAEAKQRVKSATQQSGMALTRQFLTINLSPAALPKQGSGFDLAIALAGLAASGACADERLADTAHIGELGLDGELKRPPGLLSAVLAARGLGFVRVMVPTASTREASLVPGIEVVPVPHLRAAVAWHSGTPADLDVGSDAGTRDIEVVSRDDGQHRDVPHRESELGGERLADISDVIGQDDAVEALMIAASGRHHLSMVGPPGAGKTLLASCLPSILPDLDTDESIVASSIASLGGAPLDALINRPPFVAPHHSASPVSILGGGDARGIRPGAVTRACHGVLFLDEAPEFSRGALDGLRQPLESGVIEIHRAQLRASLPARIQLVLAANPCPCGNSGSPETALSCTCSSSTRIRYLQRISGPLTDRIDLRLSVRRVSSALSRTVDQPRPSSDQLRARVVAARQAAADRLTGTPWRCNAEVPGAYLRGTQLRLTSRATQVLDLALQRGALTMRGYDRALRLGWTIADVSGRTSPGREELAYALSLRGGGLV